MAFDTQSNHGIVVRPKFDWVMLFREFVGQRPKRAISACEMVDSIFEGLGRAQTSPDPLGLAWFAIFISRGMLEPFKLESGIWL